MEHLEAGIQYPGVSRYGGMEDEKGTYAFFMPCDAACACPTPKTKETPDDR